MNFINFPDGSAWRTAAVLIGVPCAIGALLSGPMPPYLVVIAVAFAAAGAFEHGQTLTKWKGWVQESMDDRAASSASYAQNRKQWQAEWDEVQRRYDEGETDMCDYADAMQQLGERLP